MGAAAEVLRRARERSCRNVTKRGAKASRDGQVLRQSASLTSLEGDAIGDDAHGFFHYELHDRLELDALGVQDGPRGHAYGLEDECPRVWRDEELVVDPDELHDRVAPPLRLPLQLEGRLLLLADVA